MLNLQIVRQQIYFRESSGTVCDNGLKSEVGEEVKTQVLRCYYSSVTGMRGNVILTRALLPE